MRHFIILAAIVGVGCAAKQPHPATTTATPAPAELSEAPANPNWAFLPKDMSYIGSTVGYINGKKVTCTETYSDWRDPVALRNQLKASVDISPNDCPSAQVVCVRIIKHNTANSSMVVTAFYGQDIIKDAQEFCVGGKLYHNQKHL